MFAEGLPKRGSGRANTATDLVEVLMMSAVLSSRRMAHIGMPKQDDVITEQFGWDKGIGSQST